MPPTRGAWGIDLAPGGKHFAIFPVPPEDEKGSRRATAADAGAK